MRSGSSKARSDSSKRLSSAIGTLPPFEIKPQPGPQTLFATTFADIAIYGGAAGGGKSYGLQMEPLRHIMKTPGFEAVVFRRTTPQITNPGALWDTSYLLYPRTGGVPYVGSHEFRWKGGGKLKLAHLVLETTVHDWQGAQIALLMFDELTQFTAHQFWYLVSRNRSTCGVPPYVRAACNPDADSWVADFIAWWIDQETGFAIPERVGVLRYLVRGPNDSLLWGDSIEEMQQFLPKARDLPPGAELPRPKSVTFIPATIFDNQALLSVNPDYLASLLALPMVERERLLGGNWKIRPAAGLYFRRVWCEMVDVVPPMRDTVRYWDLAGTEKIEGNDPDWTVGIKLGRDEAGTLYVLDVIRERVGALAVEQLLKNCASHDGKTCKIGWGKDPGQAGVSQTQNFIRMLAGYWVMPSSETGDKVTRFGPASAQCQAGNVKIMRGPWNEDFFRCLEGFPDLTHDDDVDAFSGAMDLLHLQAPGMNVYELYRRQAAELAAKEAEKRAARAPKIVPAPGSMEHAAMNKPQGE
jgi:predicted phage terminase large subunit-like protein